MNFCSVFTILKMLFSYLSRGQYCQFEFTAMFFTAANIAPMGLLNQLFLSQTYQAQTQGIHCSSCKGVIFCFVEFCLFLQYKTLQTAIVVKSGPSVASPSR